MLIEIDKQSLFEIYIRGSMTNELPAADGSHRDIG